MLRSTALFVMLILLSTGSGRAEDCLKPSKIPDADKQEIQRQGGVMKEYVYQEFPTGSGQRTAWFVGYHAEMRRALYIRQAFFSPAKGKWIKILGRSGIAEIHVPYTRKTWNFGEKGPAVFGRNRFWDLADYSNLEPDGLAEISAAEKGPCGGLLRARVGFELRDRGHLWKKENQGRRGHELILWAAQNAYNYDYLINYHFLDDGRIRFRAGATATNIPGGEYVAHLHTAIWRIDIDLNGAKGDKVFIERYKELDGEPDPKATIEREFVSREQGIVWSPTEFTSLVVRDDKLANAHGVSTELVVSGFERGVTRHKGADPVKNADDRAERYSENDFWVVTGKASEIDAKQLATNYANGEPLDNSDITIWMHSPILHIHRGEDGECKIATTERGCGRAEAREEAEWHGVALALYNNGIEIMPRNLFGGTPFFP